MHEVEPFTPEEVFDMIRSIQDPEHPLTLESLKVVSLEHCHVDEEKQQVTVFYNPTVPQCTLTTVIGLSIHTVLDRCLPTRFHIKVLVLPGSHEQEQELNKQVNDKERATAALENPNLSQVVNRCIAPGVEHAN